MMNERAGNKDGSDLSEAQSVSRREEKEEEKI